MLRGSPESAYPGCIGSEPRLRGPGDTEPWADLTWPVPTGRNHDEKVDTSNVTVDSRRLNSESAFIGDSDKGGLGV